MVSITKGYLSSYRSDALLGRYHKYCTRNAQSPKVKSLIVKIVTLSHFLFSVKEILLRYSCVYDSACIPHQTPRMQDLFQKRCIFAQWMPQ